MVELTQRIENLEGLLNQILEAQLESNRLRRGEIEQAEKQWLDHEDMRKLFGWPPTKTNAHKAKLAKLRKAKRLTKHASQKPLLYNREEAEKALEWYKKHPNEL